MVTHPTVRLKRESFVTLFACAISLTGASRTGSTPVPRRSLLSACSLTAGIILLVSLLTVTLSIASALLGLGSSRPFAATNDWGGVDLYGLGSV